MPQTERRRKWHREWHREWRRKNPEKVRAQRKRDSVKITREQRRRYKLKHYYGLTPEQWGVAFEAQGCCCAFCKAIEPGTKQGWHTDHCHKTGNGPRGPVRWILCAACNHILGRCKENMDHLRMIIAGFEARS